jgi:hypothetical protein
VIVGSEQISRLVVAITPDRLLERHDVRLQLAQSVADDLSAARPVGMVR